MLGIIRVIFNLYLLGSSLDSLCRYEEAIDCYNQAIQIDPNYASAWNNKGNI